jgi:glutamine synthetase
MVFLAEYIWIGGNNELRSKCRVMNECDSVYDKDSVYFYPDWNYDGSSTGQAIGSDSEVIMKPRAVFKCPFRGGDNRMVLCDTYLPNGEPHITNHRAGAVDIFDKKPDEEPWFGLEQEYFLVDLKTGKPLGCEFSIPAQGPFYCGVGGGNAFGRDVVEEHLEKCLYAGLRMSGINTEVAPAQWEFQIGPSLGIEAGDHLWMARYILNRVCEKYGVRVDLTPKLIKEINGSGCHANFSTKGMRDGTVEKTGLELIDEAIMKLSKKHLEHMMVYGEGNRERMTGHHETASYDEFSFGRANRGKSVRIGNDTINNKKGYFEDRRPSSNSNPYLVTSIIFDTCCL